jgi:phosphate-selective porin OprO/OprP
MKYQLFSGVALIAALAFGGAAHAQQAPSNEELAAQVKALQQQLQALTAMINQRPIATQSGDAGAGAGAVVAARSQGAEEPLGGQAGTQGSPGGPSFTLDGALRASDGLGDSFRVQGRILIDATDENVSRDNGLFPGQTKASDYHSSNVRGRQVQIGASGQIGPQFGYVLEGGFVNGGAAQWAYAYLEYKFAKKDSLIFGNTKTAGLENITSEKYRVFMDAGPYGDLTDTSYVLSAAYVHTDTNWTFWAALQGASLNNADVTAGAVGASSANERLGETVRGTWVPINTADQKLHLGLWTRYRERGGETPLAYTAWPDTNFHAETATAASLLSAGAVGNSDFTAAGEFAWIYKNYSVQAEAMDMHVDRITTAQSATLGGPDFNIQSAYALVSWFPTGEMRKYLPSGQFGRATVLNPVDKGGYGAFELAARMSFADLSDMKANNISALTNQTSLATAGQYLSGTFALNWYPISYVKFALNYTYGEIENRRVGLGKDDATVNVLQARSQIDF